MFYFYGKLKNAVSSERFFRTRLTWQNGCPLQLTEQREDCQLRSQIQTTRMFRLAVLRLETLLVVLYL